MKTFRILITTLAGALLTAGCSINPTGVETGGGGVVDPADAPVPAAVVEARQLELRVSPENERYVVGEPVYLRVLLKNTGKEARLVPEYLDTVNGALEIRVDGPEAKDRPYRPLAVIDDSGVHKLASGEVLGNVVPVFFGANGWTFPRAGRYTLRTRFTYVDESGRRASVLAEPVTLEIGRPEVAPPPMTTPAGFQAGKFLLWQSGDHLQKGRELLLGYARQYPDARLSNYINAAFARSFSNSFTDYRKEKVREADCERALDYLQQVREETVGDYIRMQDAITGLRCAARRGDRDAVKRYAERAQQLAEGQPAYRPLARRAAQIAGAGQE